MLFTGDLSTCIACFFVKFISIIEESTNFKPLGKVEREEKRREEERLLATLFLAFLFFFQAAYHNMLLIYYHVD